MKFKVDFVTNSSSTSFIITNKTSFDKDLVDFVKENPSLAEKYSDLYGEEVSFADLVISAGNNNETIPAKSSDEYILGMKMEL